MLRFFLIFSLATAVVLCASTSSSSSYSFEDSSSSEEVELKDVLTLNGDNFKKLVQEKDSGIVFVRCHVPYCHFCHEFAHEWEKLGDKLKGVATIADINCEKWDDLCYDVVECTEFPEFHVFENGKKVKTFEGYYSYWNLYHFIANKEYLRKSSRHKRSISSELPAPNEIFQIDFANIVSQSEISIILFVDSKTEYSQDYYAALNEIENKYRGFSTYMMDCTRHSNYNICFDEIINGVPLVNFYRKGKKIVEDFEGTSLQEFENVVQQIKKIYKIG